MPPQKIVKMAASASTIRQYIPTRPRREGETPIEDYPPGEVYKVKDKPSATHTSNHGIFRMLEIPEGDAGLRTFRDHGRSYTGGVGGELVDHSSVPCVLRIVPSRLAWEVRPNQIKGEKTRIPKA